MLEGKRGGGVRKEIAEKQKIESKNKRTEKAGREEYALIHNAFPPILSSVHLAPLAWTPVLMEEEMYEVVLVGVVTS